MNNKRKQKFEDIFKMTKVIVEPKHSIPTFGDSDISYYFLASLDVKKTRLREGTISFRKPKIILSQEMEELFEGYGRDVSDFINETYQELGSELRIIGYHFKHQPALSKTISDSFSNVLRETKERTREQYRSVILTGIDLNYELSILKFTLEMISRSSINNISEFEERGFFASPEEKKVNKMRLEIESLFRIAENDSAAIKALGSKLKEYKLFSAYEDRFFNLVIRSKK